MKKSFAVLNVIDHQRPVTARQDQLFLQKLKQGLLLALREQELLTENQLRLALERLR